MGNFKRSYTDYSTQRANCKEAYLQILKNLDNPEVVCAVMNSDFDLPCNYNSRQLLKFFLKMNYDFYYNYGMIWLKDGTIIDISADGSYKHITENCPNIPQELLNGK